MAENEAQGLRIEVVNTRCDNLQNRLRKWGFSVKKFNIIMSLGNWIDLESTLQSQALCTLEYFVDE